MVQGLGGSGRCGLMAYSSVSFERSGLAKNLHGEAYSNLDQLATSYQATKGNLQGQQVISTSTLAGQPVFYNGQLRPGNALWRIVGDSTVDFARGSARNWNAVQAKSPAPNGARCLATGPCPSAQDFRLCKSSLARRMSHCKTKEYRKSQGRLLRSLTTKAFKLISAEHFKALSIDVPFPSSAMSFHVLPGRACRMWYDAFFHGTLVQESFTFPAKASSSAPSSTRGMLSRALAIW